MTIRWFTDADRQAMRDAEDASRVLEELRQKFPGRTITAEERANQPPALSSLKICPYRRTLHR